MVIKGTALKRADQGAFPSHQYQFISRSHFIQRGITDFDSARNFFRPSLEHLHNPFLMKGMERAVARLKKAIDHEEKILIYGDYDVDGTTSVALVYSYLNKFYSNCEIYIPDRYAEGYGISLAGIEYAEQNNFTLIIALDCGIKSVELVDVASLKGIDFIICDHHLPDDINTECGCCTGSETRKL